jgi:hypothetical protein
MVARSKLEEFVLQYRLAECEVVEGPFGCDEKVLRFKFHGPDTAYTPIYGAFNCGIGKDPRKFSATLRDAANFLDAHWAHAHEKSLLVSEPGNLEAGAK